MKSYEKLLQNNKEWVDKMNSDDPRFFSRLSSVQTPEFFWIGCSDSRVPANQITGTDPGEIFVHRNIANTVVHTDMNLLSVLDYAVNILKVNHVIVCGHYRCGGLLAAMQEERLGLVNNWVNHIRDVYKTYKSEIEQSHDHEARADSFAEYHVIENVINLTQTSIIRDSWIKRGGPMIHGWIYDIHNGILKDLKISTDNASEPLILKRS